MPDSVSVPIRRMDYDCMPKLSIFKESDDEHG